MADTEKRNMDFTSKSMKNLPAVIEKSIDRGFSKVLNYLRASLQTEWDKDRKHVDQLHDKDEAKSDKQRSMDAAAELREKIKANFELNKTMDRGLMKVHKNVYNFLDTQNSRFKNLSEKIPERITNAIKSYGGMIKHNLSGLIDQFTGPFSGLIKNTGKLLWSATSYLSPSRMGKGLIDKFPKLPALMEKPKEAGGEYGGSSLDLIGKIYQAITGILVAKRITTDEIKEAIYDAADWVSNAFQSVAGKSSGNLPVPAGMGAALPPMGGLATFSRFANMVKKYQDFMHQQILYANEYLENLWDYFKSGKAAGGGGGFLEGMFAGKIMQYLKATALPFLKFVGKIAAPIVAGVSMFHGVKEEAAGRKVEKLSDIIPEGFWNKLNPFEYVMRAGRWQGNKMNMGYGMLSNKFGGTGALGTDIFDAVKKLNNLGSKIGIKLFDARALIGKKMNDLGSSIGIKLFDSKVLIGKKMNDLGSAIGIKLFDTRELVGKKINDLGSGIGTGLFDAKELIGKKFGDLSNSVRGIFTKVGLGFKTSSDYIKDKIDAFLPSGTDIVKALQSALSSLMAAGAAATKFVVDAGRRAGQVASQGYQTAKKGAAVLSSEVQNIIKRASAKTGVNENLLKSVVKQESGGNPAATSRVGAQGLMQLMPGTARQLGVENPYDPEQNVMGGSKHLAYLLKKYKGDQAKALAAYNWGEGNIDRKGMGNLPRETRDYVARITADKERRDRESAPRAAMGAMVRKSGLAEIHAAEIVSPIGKFTDLLSQTASNLARPVVEKGAVFDANAMKHLATIAQGISKLIEVTAAGNVPDTSKSRPSTIPDMPGDPNMIFAGNYFPQKGSQWRG